MGTLKINNNSELETFISNMDINKDFFAIRTKNQIEVFETKGSFNKIVKTLPNVVQGRLTPYNYIYYRF